MKPPKLLKGKRFEQKPKPVKQSPDFQDRCGVKHNAQLRAQLYEIIDCIENGQPVPPEYYRGDIDAYGDRMLREIGVKHLHLGGQGSDVIVYMAEFENWVELIQIDTHVHLESDPRGKDLKGRFRAHVEAVGAAAAVAGAVVRTAVAKAVLRKAGKSKKRKRSTRL